jgi:acyl dehydratase
MLRFNDLGVEQVYRAGPYVVTEDDLRDFKNVIGGGFVEMSSTETTLFNNWAVSAFTMKLLATGELQIAGGIHGLGVEELEWGVPISPKDTLHLESKVVLVRKSQSNSEFGIVKFRTITKNQNGDMVQACTHSVRVSK